MKKYWWLLALPLVLLVWWLISRNETVPEVHVSAVTRGRIESSVPTNGKVEPVEWATARAEVAGVVQSVSVSRGQTVKPGQPLVTLDLTGVKAELAAALARQKEAQVDSQTLSAGGKPAQLSTLGSAITNAQTAVEVAQRNYDSLQRMAAANAATKFQVLEARDALERAKLQLAAAQGQRSTLVTDNDVAVSQARVQDAQAAVSAAQHRLQLGIIRAPMNGVIYQFDLKVGAYLQPGDLVANVGTLDRMRVTVYVDEPDLGRVALNDKVVITWDARPGQKCYGTVSKMPSQIIALGTRTVGEVWTVIDNPDQDLLPGVTVNATVISTSVDNALLMPKGALRNQSGVAGVYKLAGNRLEWVPVKTGIRDVNSV